MVRPGFYLGRAYINRVFLLNFTLYNKAIAERDGPAFVKTGQAKEDCWGGTQARALVAAATVIRRALLVMTFTFAAGTAVAAPPQWAIDPAEPGPDLPPAGRALFDTVAADGDPVSVRGAAAQDRAAGRLREGRALPARRADSAGALAAADRRGAGFLRSSARRRRRDRRGPGDRCARRTGCSSATRTPPGCSRSSASTRRPAASNSRSCATIAPAARPTVVYAARARVHRVPPEPRAALLAARCGTRPTPIPPSPRALAHGAAHPRHRRAARRRLSQRHRRRHRSRESLRRHAAHLARRLRRCVPYRCAGRRGALSPQRRPRSRRGRVARRAGARLRAHVARRPRDSQRRHSQSRSVPARRGPRRPAGRRTSPPRSRRSRRVAPLEVWHSDDPTLARRFVAGLAADPATGVARLLPRRAGSAAAARRSRRDASRAGDRGAVRRALRRPVTARRRPRRRTSCGATPNASSATCATARRASGRGWRCGRPRPMRARRCRCRRHAPRATDGRGWKALRPRA